MICPHCLYDILPSSGSCPNCWKKISDKPSHDLTRFCIGPDTILPKHCHLCDSPNRRMQRVTVKHRSGVASKTEAVSMPEHERIRIVLSVLGIFFAPLSLFAFTFPTRDSRASHRKQKNYMTKKVFRVSKIRLKVPTCSFCRNQVNVIKYDPSQPTFVIAACKPYVERAKNAALGEQDL